MVQIMKGQVMKFTYGLIVSLLVVGLTYSMEQTTHPRQKKQCEEGQQEVGLADGLRVILLVPLVLDPSIMNEIKFKDLPKLAALLGGGVLAKEGYNWWNQRDRNED